MTSAKHLIVDRVWHAGLIYTLEAAGVAGEVLNWLRNYLSERRQCVVLSVGFSDWTFIRAGVPQGSILCHLLLCRYINDIVNDVGSTIRLFADDTSLFIIVDKHMTPAACLNRDLEKISHWASRWLVTFIPAKKEAFLISRKLVRPSHPPLFMQNVQMEEVDCHKHLGLHFSQYCTWHTHIGYTKDTDWFRINIVRKLKLKLDTQTIFGNNLHCTSYAYFGACGCHMEQLFPKGDKRNRENTN